MSFDDLKESALMAFETLRENKLRSALTVLGVTVGVLTVLVMVSISVGSLGRNGFPEIEKSVGYYNSTTTEYTLRVKLKPGTAYEFVLTGVAFKTKAGYPISEYVVKFKTR